MAYSLKMDKKEACVVTYMGDGSTSEVIIGAYKLIGLLYDIIHPQRDHFLGTKNVFSPLPQA